MSWLPEIPTPPSFNPSALKILFFGPPKIGKSTWAASFPKTLFLCAEEGHRHLEVMRVSIDAWSWDKKPFKDKMDVTHLSFTQYLDLVEELEKVPYDTYVVDTADRLFKACRDYVCAREGITHPQDLKYGKGWTLLEDEFRKGVIRLTRLGCGVIFISHTKNKLVTIAGNETESKDVSLDGGAQKVIVPEVDIVLRADYATNEETGDTHRVIVSCGTATGLAGSRWSLPPQFPLTIRGGYEKLLGYLRGKEVPAETKKLKISNIKIKLKD